jgi:hypothetical protein
MDSMSFEHSCPRCRGHQFNHQFDPGGQHFDVCSQCHFVPGQPLTDLDRLIGQLWDYKNQTGKLSIEDVRAFQSELTPTPDTEEIRWEDPDEFAARQERTARIHEALGDPAGFNSDPTISDHPAFDFPAENIGPPDADPLPSPDPAAFEPHRNTSSNEPIIEPGSPFDNPEPETNFPDGETDLHGLDYGFLNPQIRPSHPFLAPGARDPIGFMEPQFRPDLNVGPGFGPDFGPGP